MVYVNSPRCDLCDDNLTHVFCTNLAESWRARTAHILVHQAREFRDQVIGYSLPPPSRKGRINIPCFDCDGRGTVALMTGPKSLDAAQCPRCNGDGLEKEDGNAV